MTATAQKIIDRINAEKSNTSTQESGSWYKDDLGNPIEKDTSLSSRIWSGVKSIGGGLEKTTGTIIEEMTPKLQHRTYRPNLFNEVKSASKELIGSGANKLHAYEDTKEQYHKEKEEQGKFNAWDVGGSLGASAHYLIGGAATAPVKGIAKTVLADAAVQTPLTLATEGYKTPEEVAQSLLINTGITTAGALAGKGISKALPKAKKIDDATSKQNEPINKENDAISKQNEPLNFGQADENIARGLTSTDVKIPETEIKPFAPHAAIADALEAEAKKGLGTKYKFGGASCKDGWDCSSYVQNIYKSQGINLPRTANEQFKIGKSIAEDELQKGDLVFFNTQPERGLTVSHVGMYLGDGKFIHAANKKKGTIISNFDNYKQTFVGAKRVADTLDASSVPSTNIVDDVVKASDTAFKKQQTPEQIAASAMDDLRTLKAKNEVEPKIDKSTDIEKTIDDITSPSTQLYKEIKDATTHEDAVNNLNLIEARAKAKGQDIDEMLEIAPLKVEKSSIDVAIDTPTYDKSLGKPYGEMSFDELKAHPRFDELLDMRKDVGYEQTKNTTNQTGKAGGYWNDGHNGYEYIPARYARATKENRNLAADFELTKADIKAIQVGKITPEITTKLRKDIGTLDNHPDWKPEPQAAQAGMSGKVKGMIEFGVRNDKELSAVIRVFKDADVTTIPHELGHYFRRTLNDVELAEAQKLFGKFSGEGAVEAEEKFANAFVKYLSEGTAPTPTMKTVFEKFKTWIIDTWKALKENNPDEMFELSQAHRDFFDAIMGNEAKAKELFSNLSGGRKTELEEQIKNMETDELFQAVKMQKNQNATIDDVKETLSQNRGVYTRISYNRENWDKTFPDGYIQTPLGKVKMGENQFNKLNPYTPDPKNLNRTKQDRRGHLSYIEQTLKNPAIALKLTDDIGEKLLYFKEFETPSGLRQYASVMIDRDGMNINISNYSMGYKQMLKGIKKGEVLEVYAGKNADKVTTSQTANPDATLPSSVDTTIPSKDLNVNGSEFDEISPNILFQKSDIEQIPKLEEVWNKIKESDAVDVFIGHKIYSKTEYMDAREAMMQHKNAKFEDHLQLHEKLKLLSKDARTALSRYIQGAKDIEMPGPLKDLADSYIDIINKNGEELVELGVLSKEQFEKYKGRYLHRSYEKHVKEKAAKLGAKGKTIQSVYSRGREWTGTEAEYKKFVKENKIGDFFDGKIEAIREKNGEYKFTQDWTPEQRAQWGEIEDIAFSLPETLMRMSEMAEHAKMLKTVLSTKYVMDEAFPGYVQLHGDRYGVLKGKYVPKDVAGDIREFGRAVFGREDGTFSVELKDALAASLTFWKKTHTIYNPVAHANNLFSNITMQWMEGINPALAVKNAAHGYQAFQKNTLYRELKAKELIGLSQKEANQLRALEMDTDLKLYQEANSLGLFGRSRLNDVLGNYVRGVDTSPRGILAKIDDKASKLYQGEDDIMRYSMLKSLVDMGMSVESAVKRVNNTIPDYSKPMSIAARYGRSTGLTPFISWTYYSTPIILRQLRQRPARIAALAGVIYGINQIAGIDPYNEDDIPQQNFSMHRIPIYKDGNKVMTLKVDKWIPHATVIAPLDFVKGIANLGVWGDPYGLLFNRDMYYGGKITHREGVKGAYDLGKRAVQDISPDILDKLWDLGESTLFTKEQRRKNKVIDERSLGESMSTLFGFNVLTYDKAKQKLKAEKDRIKEKKENEK